jgi:hypothetical protein
MNAEFWWEILLERINFEKREEDGRLALRLTLRGEGE